MSGLAHRLLLPVRRVKKFPRRMAKRLAGRLPLHAPDFPLVLLFTEKAGCTSLTKWFLFHTGKLEEATQSHRWVHSYRTTVLYRQPGYKWQALRLLVFRHKPIIKLVRNPYDRAVSSFLSTLNNAHGGDGKGWACELVAAARAGAGKPAADLTVLSFRDFLRFLGANGTGQGLLRGHVARQHVPGEERRVDRIIKLERFAEEIRQIESEYNLVQSPLDLITSSGHHRSASQNSAPVLAWGPDVEITTEQVHQGNVPAYDAMYDDDARRLVRQCFAADFEAYGYDE